tara:strand:- start:5762 stop:5896 length:135 start_codon:yes stop_codon:yes gene_type:complete
MINKICILIIITLLSYSCGKKGDPVYKSENQNSGILSSQINDIT